MCLLLLVVVCVICYFHYAKYLKIYEDTSIKLRKLDIENIFKKMESNVELKDIDNNNRTCYYFDDIIKIEDFDSANILKDEKSSKNVLFIAFHTKLWLV